MEGEEIEADTPEAFVAALGDSLSNSDRVDADLAGILKTHLLKIDPEDNAVAAAKDAIDKLAGERAAPPETEEADG